VNELEVSSLWVFRALLTSFFCSFSSPRDTKKGERETKGRKINKNTESGMWKVFLIGCAYVRGKEWKNI
jgi:hypothetical protein